MLPRLLKNIIFIFLLDFIDAKLRPFRKQATEKRRAQSENFVQLGTPLNSDFLPLQYNLHLHPHFLWGYPGLLNTFDADAELLIEAKTTTSRVVMNAEKLQFKNISASLNESPIELSYQLL